MSDNQDIRGGLKYPYGPKMIPLIMLAVLSPLLAYFCYTKASANQGGIVFGRIFTLGKEAADIFWWGAAFVTALSASVFILAVIAYILSPKRNLEVTRDQLKVPSWITRDIKTTRLDSIKKLELRKLQVGKSLWVYHNCGILHINSVMLPKNEDLETILKFIQYYMSVKK
ncbi:MAG: hypothetical protein WC043_07030 [Pseudobdellovibrionaceae bacterium]